MTIFSNYTRFAIQTARRAGDEILMNHYGKLKNLERTTRQHFRTQVDKDSDSFIRGRISEEFPDFSVYSEEDKDQKRNSQFSWLIDPIDGTIPYTLRISDHFSVCIALAREKRPIMGVTYCP